MVQSSDIVAFVRTRGGKCKLTVIGNWLKAKNASYSGSLADYLRQIPQLEVVIAGAGSYVKYIGPSGATVPLKEHLKSSPKPSVVSSQAIAAAPPPVPPPPAPPVSSSPAPFHLVDSLEGLHQAEPLLIRASKLAVDCEGECLGKDGRLCLVQIAVPPSGPAGEPRVFLFDLITRDAEYLAQAKALLKAVLEDGAKQKILHDLRRDSEALFFQLGVTLANVFDTQVAHAFTGYVGDLCASGHDQETARRVGLNRLLQEYGLPINPGKDLVSTLMDENRHFWQLRPLSQQAKEYAAADVAQLFRLQELIMAETARRSATAICRLSVHHSRAYIEEDGAAGSYAAAIKLHFGKPLLVRFGANAQPIYSALDPLQQEPAQAARAKHPNAADDGEMLSLLTTLPPRLVDALRPATEGRPPLVELSVDLDRPVVLHFADGSHLDLHLSPPIDIKQLLAALSTAAGRPVLFSRDNRAGLPGTLHRISAIRGRDAESIIGLTYRIGRHVPGVALMIQDLLGQIVQRGCSLLLLGRPGKGKTTLLRDIAKTLADTLRVVVVDTSNEIGGDGEVPHGCIGRARRMQVPDRARQHELLIEAVQNHTPQAIVIDEIGAAAEAAAARTIAQRGVALVGTAHGISLESLMKNPLLVPLVGGVQPVILNADEAKRRSVQSSTTHAAPKRTVLERAGAPTFTMVVEVLDHRRWRIHRNVENTVDQLLRGDLPTVEERWQDHGGATYSRFLKLAPEDGQAGGWFEKLIHTAGTQP